MRSVDDLLAEGVSGRRVLAARRPERPAGQEHRRDHRRRPDPGQPAHAAGAPGRRRPGGRGRPPRPAQGRAGPAVLPRAGRGAAGRAAGDDGAAGRRRRRRGRPGQGGGARRRRRRCCWRTSASRPPRRRKDDAERGELADRLAALADVYVDDAFGAVHRKHASVFDVAERLPHAAGRLVARELEVLTRLTDRPRAALRGRPRRLEGQRQAGRHRGAAAQGRPAAGRRRHVLHLPRRPGPRGREARCWRPTRSTPAAGCWPRPATASCCRSTSSARPSSAPTPRPASSRSTQIPDDQHGPGRRAAHRRAVRHDAGRRPHRLLERPDGRLRARALPGRHPRGRRRPSPPSTGCRSSAAGTPPPPSASWAWTRTPTATSAPAAARRWSTSRAGSSRASRCSPTDRGRAHGTQGQPQRGAVRAGPAPLIAGNWKMNLTHLEAIGLVQKLVFSLHRDRSSTPPRSSSLPPFTALRSVQTLVDRRQAGHRLRRAGPLAAGLRRLHR